LGPKEFRTERNMLFFSKEIICVTSSEVKLLIDKRKDIVTGNIASLDKNPEH
jgi:hypothetical protein